MHFSGTVADGTAPDGSLAQLLSTPSFFSFLRLAHRRPPRSSIGAAASGGGGAGAQGGGDALASVLKALIGALERAPTAPAAQLARAVAAEVLFHASARSGAGKADAGAAGPGQAVYAVGPGIQVLLNGEKKALSLRIFFFGALESLSLFF